MTEFMDDLIAEVDAKLASLRAEVTLLERVRTALTAKVVDATEQEPQRPRRQPARKRQEIVLPPLPPTPPAPPLPAPREGSPPITERPPAPDPAAPRKLSDIVSAPVEEDCEVTEAQARDLFVQQKGEFRAAKLLMDEFDISRAQANVLVAAWEERGMIGHVKGRGATARHAYIPPSSSGTPTTRPRSDSPRALDGALAAGVKRGETVAHTGKPKGPSGRPGRDKKVAERGGRVKRARQGT